ncbi:MAG: nucleoside deaminase [Bacteroidales bacterium]|nr:nucleoside deaminase [Bacteroidales bacterium]
MFSDEYYMHRALAEAMEAFDADEVPIGAVVVLNDQIIGKGHNLTQTLNDVTAHAEMQAITAAASYLGAKYLNDCTLYVTLEPCVMCAGAIAWAQVGRLVYAASDPKKGYTTLQKPILHPKTEVVTGVLQTEASDLVKQFFQSKRK